MNYFKILSLNHALFLYVYSTLELLRNCLVKRILVLFWLRYWTPIGSYSILKFIKCQINGICIHKFTIKKLKNYCVTFENYVMTYSEHHSIWVWPLTKKLIKFVVFMEEYPKWPKEMQAVGKGGWNKREFGIF